MDPDIRKLEASRISQAHENIQAHAFVPVARGAQGPQRSSGTMNQLQGAQMATIVQSPLPSPSMPTVGPREVKVEVVSDNFDAQFAALRAHQEQVQAGERQLLQQHGEAIRLLQGELRALQETFNNSEDDRVSIANADRVSIEMEVKDLRVHLDAQGKLLQARSVTWENELMHLRDMIGAANSGHSHIESVSAELKYVCDSVALQNDKVATLEAQMGNLEELISEDRGQLTAVMERTRQDGAQLEACTVRVAETARQMAAFGNVSSMIRDAGASPEMQEQLSQQGQFIRELQTELVGISRSVTAVQVASKDTSLLTDSVSEMQGELKRLRTGSEKNHADLTLKQSSLSKDISDVRVQLSAKPESQAETKELRKFVDMKFAQQELSVQALRTQMGSLDEITQTLTLPPVTQGQSQSTLEVDALKKELAEQRKLQASELQHEADDLHRHIASVVSTEREARSAEIKHLQATVELLRDEVVVSADSTRKSGCGASGSLDATSLISEQFECINPKLLDATQYIAPTNK